MNLDLVSIRARIQARMWERARYLALALPLFAIFSTVHAGCIRGSSGYGRYGVYGYGGRATASGTLHPDEGECVVYSEQGERRPGGYDNGNCDDGDIDDGYGESGGPGHRVAP